MHSPTLLNVPAIESENGAFSRLTQEQLVQWLRELPRGNPDACAEILLDGIRGMNRSPLRRLSRFQLAEALRPVVNDIAETLVKRYRAASLPLPEDAAAQAETVSRLYQELTVGFRHAVNEQMKARRLRRTEAQLAIQRALLTQGRALLEAYRIYMPEPRGFWQTLHTLYANAEALKLQALPIEGTRDSDETALSVKQAYLRSVILSLANPYHLMQDEAEELYRRIGRWVHFARLSRPSPEAPLGGSFVLDLASDFPPRYVAQQHGTSVPVKDARVLELGQLVSTLDQQIAQLDENIRHGRHTSTLSQRLQRSMYQRFQDALGGRQERTSERRPTMARIRLVDGLARCHFMLNGQQPFQPEDDERRWRRKIADASRGGTGLELAGDEDLRPHGSNGRRTAQFNAFDAEADDIWTKANRIDARGEDHTAETGPTVVSATFSRKNQSAGGMAVFHPRRCPLGTRVGDLVAHGEPDSDNRADNWRLATVRWLRTRSEQGLEMGLEFLADSGHAAASKAISGPGAGSAYMRTLIVPRVNPLMASATLIAPANVYDVGTRLALNLGELVIQVQLTEILESTRVYGHYRYRVLPAADGAR